MYRRSSSMPSSSSPNEAIHPRTVLEIFQDFCLRRLGFLRAFTIDVDSFYSSCDPEMERLCAYAYPDGSWDVTPRAVTPPAVNLAPRLPEPRNGINLARDRVLRRRDWLSLVASLSDSWLQSLASFFSAHLSLQDRNRLFDMINGFPTLFEQAKLLYEDVAMYKPKTSMLKPKK